MFSTLSPLHSILISITSHTGSGQGALNQILKQMPNLFASVTDKANNVARTYSAAEIYSFVRYVHTHTLLCVPSPMQLLQLLCFISCTPGPHKQVGGILRLT